MPLNKNKFKNIKVPYLDKREIANRERQTETVRITANAIISINYRFR
mgnify:CR=1 FL=1